MAREGRHGSDAPDTGARRFAAALAGHQADEVSARAAMDDAAGVVRGAAIGALVRMGRASERDIAAATTDADPGVRRMLCELAPRLAHLDVSSLLEDPDAGVVEAAAFACGETNAQHAVPMLVTIAGSHEDPLCRESAVAALGAIGAEAGRAAILQALNDVAQIRRRAVIALAAFSGSDVDAALRDRLEDRDWQVRQAAEDVLGNG